MNRFDWLNKWAQYTPNKTAITTFENSCEYSFKELNDSANHTVNLLVEKYDINKGDRIAVLAENCIEYFYLFGAAQKLGFIIVPLNYRLAKPELSYIINDCNPKILFCEEQFKNKIDSEILDQNKLFDLNNISTSLKEFSTETNIKCIISDEDPIFILYTSGTTSKPKGALYTHQMMFYNSINTELRLNITSDDITINAAPPFHTGSWNVLSTPFLHHGASTIMLKNFDAKLSLKIMEEHKISIWWGVPTMLKMLSDDEEFENTNLTSLRYLIIGGEALPESVIEMWHKRDVMIRQGYGLTEVGPNVTSLEHTDAIRKLGSIGLPNFYYDIKIIDDKGNTVTGEGNGELLLAGPTVTPGYWNNNKATEETIVDGYFHTGDIAQRDSDGFLYIIDRIKNMYISGGENVYPAEVEHIIQEMESVNEVAIIGIPDERWGECGKAFIVLNENKELTQEDVIIYCKTKLAKYKIPKVVELIKEMPKNDTGKIDRKYLKAQNDI